MSPSAGRRRSLIFRVAMPAASFSVPPLLTPPPAPPPRPPAEALLPPGLTIIVCCVRCCDAPNERPCPFEFTTHTYSHTSKQEEEEVGCVTNLTNGFTDARWLSKQTGQFCAKSDTLLDLGDTRRKSSCVLVFQLRGQHQRQGKWEWSVVDGQVQFKSRCTLWPPLARSLLPYRRSSSNIHMPSFFFPTRCPPRARWLWAPAWSPGPVPTWCLVSVSMSVC